MWRSSWPFNITSFLTVGFLGNYRCRNLIYAFTVYHVLVLDDERAVDDLSQSRAHRVPLYNDIFEDELKQLTDSFQFRHVLLM